MDETRPPPVRCADHGRAGDGVGGTKPAHLWCADRAPRPPPVCGPPMKPAYRAGVEGDDDDKGRLRLVVADDVPCDLAPGRVAHHALADHHVPRDAMQASNK